MALFGHGGRSKLDTSAPARTRPSAWASGTLSCSRIGEASARSSNRASASSTGISGRAAPNSATALAGLDLLEMDHEIAGTVPCIQLLGKDSVPASTAGIG
ncbi:hypothetical protein D3C86_1511480 [compost metagenome]